MEVVNVLLGAYIEKNGVDVTKQVAVAMQAEIAQAGISAGLFDSVTTRDEITAAIKSNKYDVVICQEELSGVSIGGGSIREWKELNPKLKIILIVDAQKRKGAKLKNLHVKCSYYDALYGIELTGVNLAKLIKQSRSKEEAFLYYGLEEEKAEKEERVESTIEEIVSAEPEILTEEAKEEVAEEAGAALDEFLEPDGAMETLTEKSEEEGLLDAFDSELRNMEQLFHEQADRKKEPEMEQTKDNSGFFGGSSLFTNTINNRMPEDKEMGEDILKEFGGPMLHQEKSREVYFGGSVLQEEIPPVTASSITSVAVASAHHPLQKQIKHLKGNIAEVMEEQLLAVVFDAPLVLQGTERVSDYVFTMLVQLQEGHMENGRYRTGIVSLKGYGNCMIDDYIAVVEVVDRDLSDLADRIKARDCNVILTKQQGV